MITQVGLGPDGPHENEWGHSAGERAALCVSVMLLVLALLPHMPAVGSWEPEGSCWAHTGAVSSPGAWNRPSAWWKLHSRIASLPPECTHLS